MIIFFRASTLLALVVALCWLYQEPKFDSYFASAIALAAVVALFIQKKDKKKPNQSQHIGDNSFGIQAGGNVNLEIEKSKERKTDA